MCNEGARQSMYGRPFVTFAVNNSMVLNNFLTLFNEKRTSTPKKELRLGNDVSNQFKQQINELTTKRMPLMKSMTPFSF